MAPAKILYLVFLISVPILSFCQINFQQTSYTTAVNTSVDEGKSFFVYVHARWCLPCQLMDENTFQDKHLEGIIEEQFTPYKIDFDSPMAISWKEEFDISCLPTFLLFDDKGNITDRIESSLSAVEFSKFLKGEEIDDVITLSHVEENVPQQKQPIKSKTLTVENQISQLNASIVALEKLIEVRSGSAFNNEDLVESLSLLKNEVAKLDNKPVHKQHSIQVSQSSNLTLGVPRHKEYYEVQVGAFRSEQNAEMLNKKVGSTTNLSPYIINDIKNGKPLFRVVLGSYNEKNLAIEAKSTVSKAGFDGFIKSL